MLDSTEQAWPDDVDTGKVAGISAGQVKSIIERVERLHEEKNGIESDISDVFKEAKANGYNVKALKVILKIRADDPDKRRELDADVELYAKSLGMVL